MARARPDQTRLSRRIYESWTWTRDFLFTNLLPLGSVTESEFLDLTYQQSGNQDEVLWILGQYMEIVTKEAITKDR